MKCTKCNRHRSGLYLSFIINQGFVCREGCKPVRGKRDDKAKQVGRFVDWFKVVFDE